MRHDEHRVHLVHREEGSHHVLEAFEHGRPGTGAVGRISWDKRTGHIDEVFTDSRRPHKGLAADLRGTARSMGAKEKPPGTPSLPGVRHWERRGGLRVADLTDEDKARGNAVLDGFQPRRFASDQEAAGYLKTRTKGVTKDQADAVNRYTGDTFHDLNRRLRAGHASDPEVARLDGALRPAPDDLIVTRHVGADAFGLKDSELSQVEHLPGKKIQDDAYSSASLGSPHAGGLGGVTMHIAVPKGTPMVNEAALSSNPHEREVLLGRGQSLAVSKVTRNKRYGYDLYATVLGAGE